MPLAAQRLANLDTLRAMAQDYVNNARGSVQSASTGGLLAQLLNTAEGREDMTARLGGADSIAVVTWHSAKGLEWPVVVLDGLDKKELAIPSALGVHMMQREQGFDLADPLAERWIRYWPWPYQKMQSTAPLVARVANSDIGLRHQKRQDQESLRLLYVAFTRARDKIVLPAPVGKMMGHRLRVLTDSEGNPLLRDLPADAAEDALVDMDWAGGVQPVFHRRLQVAEGERAERQAGSAPVASGPRAHPPAWRNPSALEGRGTWAKEERLAPALSLQGDAEQMHLGSAVHGFFAADDPEAAPADRLAMAKGLLQRWRVSEAVKPEQLLDAHDRLRAWVAKRWPEAQWHRELAMQQRMKDGSVLRGTCDLALQTPEGWVVIDHKVLGGKEDRQRHEAASYLPQLEAYAAAIKAATGKGVLELILHLPLAGLVFSSPGKSQ